jgi:myo-inositol-1(or 4)-monophosphatase
VTTNVRAEFIPEISAIAREAGKVLMDYFRQHIGFEYKGDADLVTDADRASERLIVSRLHQRWPDHGIAGEEGSNQQSESGYRWYVDPLDGTTNFAHGYPVFCVSIGLERAGVPQAGVLYDPTRDELGSLASSATRTPISTSITSSHCEVMACAAPVRRRSIWQASPPDVLTGTGSSTCTPGIR